MVNFTTNQANAAAQANSVIIINSGNVVLENCCLNATLVIHNDIIKQIIVEEQGMKLNLSDIMEEFKLETEEQITMIDASNKYILPGLVDIHCDAIEKEIQPRPNTLFPLEMSLLEFERKLPLNGITTMYHSLSLGVGLSLRGYDLVDQCIDIIHRYNSERSIVRNLIHLRYEIAYIDALHMLERYIEQEKIHYMSFMDHSPGQGQYRKAGSFEKYVMKNQGVTAQEVQQIIDDLLVRRAAVNWDKLSQIAWRARSKGIAVASHDDDTSSKIDEAISCGVNVSEFPITLEVAQYAVKQGMHVCVGAPNVVRGASHDHNLRAEDAIIQAGADIICSDYYPASLLQAVFKLHVNGLPLHESVKLASLNPANALGISQQLGSIDIGKKADLIVIDQFHDLPFVEMTIVNGAIVYTSRPYFQV